MADSLIFIAISIACGAGVGAVAGVAYNIMQTDWKNMTDIKGTKQDACTGALVGGSVFGLLQLTYQLMSEL